MDRHRTIGGNGLIVGLCIATRRGRRCKIAARRDSGSLLNMVESRALMVVEVLRHDQTLPRKSGSRST
jgi:hypothetical protein